MNNSLKETVCDGKSALDRPSRDGHTNPKHSSILAILSQLINPLTGEFLKEL